MSGSSILNLIAGRIYSLTLSVNQILDIINSIKIFINTFKDKLNLKYYT